MQQATTSPQPFRRLANEPGAASLRAARLNPYLDGPVRATRSTRDGTLDPAQLAGDTARTRRLFLGHAWLLRREQRASAADDYRRRAVASDGAFSIVALVYHVAPSTSVHDHVSWCAIGSWARASVGRTTC